MNGKSLILMGLGASALYTYFCISTHKDQLYEKLYPSVVAADVKSDTKEEPVTLVQEESLEVVKKDYPSFAFVNSEPYKFNAILEKDAQHSEIIQQITQWCQAKSCENEIQFLENIKKEPWSTETKSIVSYMMENRVKNGSLTIKENTILITGELKNKQAQEEIEKLLMTFDSSIQVQNETTIIEIPTVEIHNETVREVPKVELNQSTSITVTTTIEEPQVTTKVLSDDELSEEAVAKAMSTIGDPIIVTKEVTETTEEISEDTTKIETAQSEINTLLQNAVINFQLNSSEILPSSQKVLDNIIQIVNDLNMEIKLSIAGHTDASGSADYNKKLSQQRADSVKKYLLNKGIKAQGLTSTGYGEEKLIFAPNDKKNRRVEIALKRGE